MPARTGLEQMARWEIRLSFTWTRCRAFASGEEYPLMLTSATHPYTSLVDYPCPEEEAVVSVESEEPSSSDERL